VIVAGDLFPVGLDLDAPTTAWDGSLLAASRKAVLAMADVIVTGHGPIIAVDRTTRA